MATYRLRLTVKIGGKASLDEFAETSWEGFEVAQVGRNATELVLRRRYPAADVRLALAVGRRLVRRSHPTAGDPSAGSRSGGGSDRRSGTKFTILLDQ